MTTSCPICSNHDFNFFFEQDNVPVFQNKVYETYAQALVAEVGKVKLTQCNYCGFVFNSNFKTDLMVYDEHYHNEQGCSQVFKEHLNEVLDLLLSFNLVDKKVVEIGCGKGYFMDRLLAKNVDVIGFDPTYEGDSPRVVKDYFSKKYSGLNADIIILRHTLEHIPNVLDFLNQIAEANNFRGKIFIEVPTFDWIMKKQSFWDIFYEHCNYFTEETLGQMFETFQTGALFGGQYIYLWGDLSTLKKKIRSPSMKNYEKLSFTFTIDNFKKILSQNKNRLAVWGAAAKGSTFLNLLDPRKEFVKYVVDINPAKQNKFIAKTVHPIFPPNIIKTNPVDIILVMNENYYDEIVSLVNDKSILINSI